LFVLFFAGGGGQHEQVAFVAFLFPGFICKKPNNHKKLILTENINALKSEKSLTAGPC
jgi:hypothetical protein